MSNPANIRLLDNTLSNISKMLYYIRTGSQELTSAGLDLLENQGNFEVSLSPVKIKM